MFGRRKVKNFVWRLWTKAKFHAPRACRKIKLLAPERWVAEGVVVAGPYVGELGFEIGEWVPHIKGLRDSFKCRVHVFTRRGHEVLYPFAETIQTFDFPGEHLEKNWLRNPSEEEVKLYDELENDAQECAAKYKSQGKYLIFEKSDRARLMKVFRNKVPVLLNAPEERIEKWENTLPATTKVVLSYRAGVRGKERNSNVDLLRQIAEFAITKGWTPITVGKIDNGFPVPDIAGINLINKTSIADLIAIYKLSSAVVGSSTGIIHLAAACGVPHITWGSTYPNDRVIVRYNKEWNLNNTWVRFLSKSWDVNFADIAGPLEEAIKAHRTA